MVQRFVSVGDDFTLPASVLGPLNSTYEEAGAMTPRRNRAPLVLPESLAGFNLARQSAIGLGAAASWKETNVFLGGDVVFDPATKGYALVYSGYSATSLKQTIGIAYSNDLLNWVDYGSNPVFGAGTAGQPDFGGATFPQLVWDDGVWHMFYIGFAENGFEGGTATILRATAPALTGPWTRQGVVIAPQAGTWAPNLIYKPNVFKHNGTWYMFTNGGDTPGNEVIGYATAPALTGPWTLATTPSINTALSGMSTVADPDVFRIDDMFYMLLWSHYGTYLASTSVEDFPNNWAWHGKVINNINDSGAFEQTTARPISVFNSDGLTVLTCRGGAPTAMDVYRSKSSHRTRMFGVSSRTAGDFAVTTINWALSAPTPYTPYVTLQASPGDLIQASASIAWGNQSMNSFVDICTNISGANIKAFSTGVAPNNAAQGLVGGTGRGATYSQRTVTATCQVQASDIDSKGHVTVALLFRLEAAGSKTVYATAATPLRLEAINLGQGTKLALP